MMVADQNFQDSADSITAVMHLCTIIKDFFRFVNEAGVSLPYEANYSHLEAYRIKLIESGIDDGKIAYTVQAIKQFYMDRLNHPLI